MILAGKKGRNTVQAVVIFRNFMDEGRSSVNQTNNDIKNASGAERVGAMRRICEKPKKGLYIVCKSGEFVNAKWENR